jgi:hypothetical protein
MNFTYDEARDYWGACSASDPLDHPSPGWTEERLVEYMEQAIEFEPIVPLALPLKNKINTFKNILENPMGSITQPPTTLKVINDREVKFIVLERFSGTRYECNTFETAKGYCKRNLKEGVEFIILEVKAIAGPKKPELDLEEF